MTVLENPTTTPYSIRRPHTSPVSANERNHHYLLNFAVSLAAILFGIAIIAAFALAVRWRKRTSQSYLLEPRIDTRMPQGSISDVSDGHSTISLKFPPPGLAPPRNPRDRLPFLPRSPPHAHHPTSHARALQTCQSCIAGPNNAPPCYCPTCPNGPGWDNPPAYRASAPSPNDIPSRRLSATLVNPHGANPPRPSSTDENSIRRIQRTPPAQIASRNGHDRPRSVQHSSTPAGHTRGGVTVVDEDNTISCFSESSSSTLSPSNASFVSASSRLDTSVARPSSPGLSHDAGAAALIYGRGPDATAGRGPLELPLAVYQDQSDDTSAYIRVTPPSQDRLDAHPDGPRYGRQTTAPESGSSWCLHGPSSSTAAVEGRDPLTGADGPHAREKSEKWFMDLDWFGRRSLSVDFNEHALATGRGFGSAI
ncbi:hypothetical protein GSI_09448 [Ganoderma sinense ZZ0214-1]|uniref:Uncharacterized protein n=1 Tax=Ganoderma sinense ZZ0214-1 TaxID=1077348 RepID=A0A2G8S6J0_9APHY|nr:hypothetical protein GSI_09448 [Ganoderma sinense ZZ0214-1]